MINEMKQAILGTIGSLPDTIYALFFLIVLDYIS